jgi:2-phospho-L-lactate guanylyltransferase
MSWTAVIPLNLPALRKSRLASVLSPGQRNTLAEALYQHVLGCVHASGLFTSVLTLSPPPALALPTRRWIQRGKDLNAELNDVRHFVATRLLVLNADLPLLTTEDLRTLLVSAEAAGCAIAADRHGSGTNAVALLPEVRFSFAFGAGSLAAHLRAAPLASVVLRDGLACDLDTPEDLAHLLRQRVPARIECLLRGPSPATWAHAE